MIKFDVDWSDPSLWLTGLVLLILLVVQIYLILWKNVLLPRKKRFRLALNLLLWLLLTAFVLQPTWQKTSPSTSALIAGSEVPAGLVQRVKDSLRIQEDFTALTFKGDFETVTLVGQDFPAELPGGLSQSVLRWIPYFPPNQLRAIQWKGVVRKGELQRVTGSIQSSEPQVLKIRFGNKTLDSLMLRKGDNSFTLQFPAFSRGRTQAELVMNGKTLDTIRFFTRPAEPRRYQLILDNPDFESKTLAEWLGKNGHSVQMTTLLSRAISRNLKINQGGKPDIFITDPANATHPLVRRAVSEGKAVLFINLTNPEADSRAINQALGSTWRVRKTANAETVPIGNGLTALPYVFVPVINQRTVESYPVAVQKTAGKVGVSLISETFPLKLSGDSVAYDQLWQAILGPLQPLGKNNVSIEAPLFRPIQGMIQVNNGSGTTAGIRLESDTVRLTYSSINPLSAEARYRFSRTGWQAVQDSLEVYVEDDQRWRSVAQRVLLSTYLLAHSNEQTNNFKSQKLAGQRTDTKLPDWAWLLLFITSLTALWVEPKFS
ncbi:MAG: hypothetical protein LH606_00055 [Cytophagaceae bacterium]|nr:hypothetical protein [Cytophagaceae bacterium]